MAQVTLPASGAGRTLRTAGSAAPRRDELIDAVALVAATMIAIAGFRPAYGGHGYLAAGAAGVLLGLLISHFGQRARLPLLTVVAASILAFLLFGGIVSQDGTVSLPVLRSVAGTAVSGWQQLLTTARPVGRTAGLLVLPYLLGLFSGVAGHALARRGTLAAAPAAAPAVVAGLSILFGAAQPVAAVLQGAGLGVLTLAWAAVRQQRGAHSAGTIGRQRPWQRIGAAAAVLAVAGAGAVVVGPHLPGAHAHQRVVLTVQPPFDVTAYPSPLAGFRDYTKDVPAGLSEYATELLAVSGLPAGGVVRIAAMDSYDGLAWGVANAAAGSSFSGYQRVGALLPGALPGPARTVAVTVQPGYDLPWLPDLAGTTGFAFSGQNGSEVQAALRFNVATTTGIIPGGVPAGLRYMVSAAATPPPAVSRLAAASPEGTPDLSIQIPAAVSAFAQAHSLTATTPMGKVLALAGYLRENGRYSNGGGAQSVITAGHGAGRLTAFLEGKQIIGDDEQYAAAMALLASAVGVPARVSLDGTVEANGTVYGKDVRADIELDTAEYGWVTLPASQFTGTKSPQLQQQKVTPPPQPVKVVPPRRGDAAPVAAANSSSAVSRTAATPHSASRFVLPAIVVTLLKYGGSPIAAVVLLAAALIGLKAARRRRRRSLGAPSARVAGAWRELLDLGRDLGIAPAAAGAPAPTRREFAARAEARGLPSAGAVAVAADAAIFGPGDPDDAAVAGIWQLVAEARRAATAGLPLPRRTWVAVNPASLVRP